MESYQGIIIEESLVNKTVLKKAKILSTKIEDVTEKHKTPWVPKWTLDTVEIPEDKAEEIATEISTSLDPKHKHNWYADFKNTHHHYIIYKDRVFYIDRSSKEQYKEARQYGINLGIPEYQVDFEPNAVVWDR